MKIYSRLRTLYCLLTATNHYDFDQLVADGKIRLGDVIELLKCSCHQINNAGLYDYVFAEKSQSKRKEKRENQDRREQIKKEIQALGTFYKVDGLSDDDRAGYMKKIEELSAEDRELRQKYEKLKDY